MTFADYITVRQGALLAGCTKGTICAAIRSKNLRAIKVRKNKCVHYEIHALDFARWQELGRMSHA